MHGITMINSSREDSSKKMKHSGTHLNIVSFSWVLGACSHAGLVDEGCTYFTRQ